MISEKDSPLPKGRSSAQDVKRTPLGLFKQEPLDDGTVRGAGGRLGCQLRLQTNQPECEASRS
jgi:hypothetical protein